MGACIYSPDIRAPRSRDFSTSWGTSATCLAPRAFGRFRRITRRFRLPRSTAARWRRCRAIATFKSVGVHVASDALALGNLAGAHPQGGAVIIMGEDPWCDSTQVPADSRFLCEHLRMPVVEPGSPQQLKDWIDLSFKLSQSAGLYIGYIVHRGAGGWRRQRQLPAESVPDAQHETEIRAGYPADRSEQGPASAANLAAGIAFPRAVRSHNAGGARIWESIGSFRLRKKMGPRRLRSDSSSPAWRGPYLEHVLFDLELIGHVPDSADGHELSGGCRTGRGIFGIVPEHDRHRGAAQLPGEKYPRWVVPGVAT